jgi:HSP20 family protein
MATQTPWDPWNEMRRLQRDLETLFGRSMDRRAPGGDEFPPINISRGEQGALVVEALCPGVDRATFDITLVGDSLTIRGERRAEAVPDNRYHRRERQVGPFTRAIRLGDRYDSDRVDAVYRDGILRLTLSRAPEAQTRKITIQG